jgi:hypothetical protein
MLVDGAEPIQQDAGAQEQRSLHAPVTHDVQGRRGDSLLVEQCRTEQEQPDVADRGVGEQALDVPLPHAGHRTDQRGDRADRQHRVPHRRGIDHPDEDDPPPPRGRVHAARR